MAHDKRICVIGCGVAGLSALRVFSEGIDGFPANYSICGYERRDVLGGVWNYDENPDTEWTSPMYRDLK